MELAAHPLRRFRSSQGATSHIATGGTFRKSHRNQPIFLQNPKATRTLCFSSSEHMDLSFSKSWCVSQWSIYIIICVYIYIYMCVCVCVVNIIQTTTMQMPLVCAYSKASCIAAFLLQMAESKEGCWLERLFCITRRFYPFTSESWWLVSCDKSGCCWIWSKSCEPALVPSEKLGAHGCSS